MHQHTWHGGVKVVDGIHNLIQVQGRLLPVCQCASVPLKVHNFTSMGQNHQYTPTVTKCVCSILFLVGEWPHQPSLVAFTRSHVLLVHLGHHARYTAHRAHRFKASASTPLGFFWMQSSTHGVTIARHKSLWVSSLAEGIVDSRVRVKFGFVKILKSHLFRECQLHKCLLVCISSISVQLTPAMWVRCQQKKLGVNQVFAWKRAQNEHIPAWAHVCTSCASSQHSKTPFPNGHRRHVAVAVPNPYLPFQGTLS